MTTKPLAVPLGSWEPCLFFLFIVLFHFSLNKSKWRWHFQVAPKTSKHFGWTDVIDKLAENLGSRTRCFENLCFLCSCRTMEILRWLLCLATVHAMRLEPKNGENSKVEYIETTITPAEIHKMIKQLNFSQESTELTYMEDSEMQKHLQKLVQKVEMKQKFGTKWWWKIAHGKDKGPTCEGQLGVLLHDLIEACRAAKPTDVVTNDQDMWRELNRVIKAPMTCSRSVEDIFVNGHAMAKRWTDRWWRHNPSGRADDAHLTQSVLFIQQWLNSLTQQKSKIPWAGFWDRVTVLGENIPGKKVIFFEGFCSFSRFFDLSGLELG